MNQLPWFTPLSEPMRATDDRRRLIAATPSASSSMFANAAVLAPAVTNTPSATTSWWSDLVDHAYEALMKFVSIKRGAEWIRDAVDWGALVDWIGNLLHMIQLRTRH
jgi:hypothetical protein